MKNRILHVSDLHANVSWLNWLVDAAPDYALICLTGDLLNLGSVFIPSDIHVAMVLPFLTRIRTPLAICSGNHDELPNEGVTISSWMDDLRRKNVWLDGDTFRLFGKRFRCVGWGEPVPTNGGDDFWLIHAPPYGVPASTTDEGVSFGCSELREVCLRGKSPRFLLGGHIHQPVKFWSVVDGTLSLNTGQGNHPAIPNHWVIDLDLGTATHQWATSAGIKLTTINLP